MCCQFCFRIFLKKEKPKLPLPNGFIDPLGEIDQDAIKLAAEFERKYPNGAESRSTAKGSLNTDKGSGYDENNGFIDDSEAVRMTICKLLDKFMDK